MPTHLIPGTWEVPGEFRERLGERPGRQRVMFSGGHLLFVLHEPPKPDEPTRRARLFWREPSGTWHSTSRIPGSAALRSHIEELERTIDQFDKLEDSAVKAGEFLPILEAISPLRRTSENLHRVLEEARQLLPGDRDLINLRDRAYDVSRTAELLYDATRNALDIARTKRAEEQAAASEAMATAAHRLNLLAAFFFPLATLATVFGMELPTGIEKLEGPWPFLAICGAGLFLGLLVAAFFLKRRPA